MSMTKLGILALTVVWAAAPAAAGEYSYADGRGNLVVESDAGYKRIIVGQAAQAHNLGAYLDRAKGYVDGLGATRAYPDSQGNLTIRAAAGYKHILVGRADEIDMVARQIRSARDARNDPGADFYSEEAAHTTPVVCAGRDGILKGRSYMYGLDRNETPVILTCE